MNFLYSVINMVFPFPRKSISRSTNKILRQGYRNSPKKKDKRESIKLPKPCNKMDAMWWGGHWLPISQIDSNFFFLGSAGSGKTLLNRITLASILRTVKKGSDNRVVIIDTKGEILSLLKGMRVKYDLININDVRAAAWDLAKDCQDYTAASELGYILQPPSQGKGDSFFEDGSRAVLVGLMHSFIYSHGADWDLSDIINAVGSGLENLITLLKIYPGNRGIIEYLLEASSEKTRDSIMMTILVNLSRLFPAAAHSQRAKKKISLTEFLRKPGVLVITQDNTARESSNPIIQAMFKRLVELTNALPDNPRRRIWIYSDETRFIGKLPGLLDFVIHGRSKGGRAIITSQTIEGLNAVYGKDEASEILGNCLFSTVLKSPSETSSNWAAKLFGTFESWEENDGVTFNNKGGMSSSNRTERRRREYFHADEFKQLHLPSKKKGATGFFLCPFTDGYQKHFTGKQIEALKPPSIYVPGQISKPKEQQVLLPWTKAEQYKFLGAKSPEISFPDIEAYLNQPQSTWEKEIRHNVFQTMEALLTEEMKAYLRQVKS